MASTPHPSGGDRSAWIVSAGMTLLTSVTGFFLAVFFSRDLGFSGRQIGLLFALQAVTFVLVSAPAGLFNDLLASRRLIAISLLGQAAGLAGMGLVRSFLPYLAVFFAFTAANALFRLSLDVLILKTGRERPAGGRIGTYQAFRFVGLTAGTLLAGYLIESLDFPRTLLTIAVLLLCLLIPVAGLHPTPTVPQRLADYRGDMANPRVALFALWVFLFSTHWGAEQTSYGLFLRQTLGLSWAGMGWYMAGEFLVMVGLFALAGRRIGPETPLRWLTIVGLLLSGAGHMGQLLQPVWLSALARMVHGAGDACIMLVFYLGIHRMFAVERIGGTTGLLTMATMVGQVAGSFGYSLLGEAYGYGAPLFVSGALTVGLALPLLPRRTGRENPSLPEFSG